MQNTVGMADVCLNARSWAVFNVLGLSQKIFQLAERKSMS